MHLSSTVFEIYRVICRKSEIFPTPHVFGAPVGVTALEFHQDPWQQKTRVPQLPWALSAWRCV